MSIVKFPKYKFVNIADIAEVKCSECDTSIIEIKSINETVLSIGGKCSKCNQFFGGEIRFTKRYTGLGNDRDR